MTLPMFCTSNTLFTHPAVEIELWHKQINEVYLNTLAVGVHQFTPPQITVFESIAFTCPLVGGEATYRARGMYAVIKDTVFDDQQLCALAGFYYKKEPSNVVTNVKDVNRFSISPNPADEYTYLHSSVGLYGVPQLEITDFAGRILFNSNVSFDNKMFKLSTSQLLTGTYILRLSGGGNALFTSKLNVVHQ